jgi:hypothetical protein
MYGRKDASTGGAPQGMCHQHHHQRYSMPQYSVEHFIRCVPLDKQQLNLAIIATDRKACQEPIEMLSPPVVARDAAVSDFALAGESYHWPVNSKLIFV